MIKKNRLKELLKYIIATQRIKRADILLKLLGRIQQDESYKHKHVNTTETQKLLTLC